jgi:hypothetical protein
LLVEAPYGNEFFCIFECRLIVKYFPRTLSRVIKKKCLLLGHEKTGCYNYRTTQQRSHLSKRGTNQPASKGPAPPPTSPSSTSDLRHKTQQQHPNGFYDLNPKTVTKNQQHTPQRYRGGVTHKTRQENERNQNGHKNPDPHLKTA